MAKYPGPLLCKLSKFRLAWLFHQGKVHLYLKKLHDKYGPIVRIGKFYSVFTSAGFANARVVQGPNELSIIEVDLLPHILGQQGMPKGPMWEGRQPTYIKDRKTGGSIVTLRDADLHAKYRKPWTRAFGHGPLADYEENLVVHANEMIKRLRENCENSTDGIGRVDMAQRFTYLRF